MVPRRYTNGGTNSDRQVYKAHYKIEFGQNYVVLHLDGDEANNDISNMMLVPTSIAQRLKRARRKKPDGVLEMVGMSDRHWCAECAEYLAELADIYSELAIWAQRKHCEDVAIKRDRKVQGNDNYAKFRAI